MNRPPLNYRPPCDDPLPPGPWWKFRFERHHIVPVLVFSALMTIAPLHAAYVGWLHRRRITPPPATSPVPTSRPNINVNIPPL
jgi:hypothetical protein